jgi:hypothetical protein
MKHSLPMLFAFCLILIAARAGATQLTVCDAAIQDTPGRWSVDSRTSCRAVLKKRFESNGYWHDEWISIQAAADNYDHLQDTLNDLYKRYDFRLVDRERLDFAKMSAPFWIMYKSGEGDEAIWLALVLHRGLTYSVELRASTLDISAVTEFGQILGAFDFLPDNREEGMDRIEYRRRGRRGAQILRFGEQGPSGCECTLWLWLGVVGPRERERCRRGNRTGTSTTRHFRGRTARPGTGGIGSRSIYSRRRPMDPSDTRQSRSGKRIATVDYGGYLAFAPAGIGAETAGF